MKARSTTPTCLSQLPLLVHVARARGKKRGPKRRPESGVPHRARPIHKGRHPIHVTLRIRSGLPSLRQQVIVGIIRQILREQRGRAYGANFQVVEHSIQSNHIHFILEAADGPTQAPETRKKNALRSGITGFKRAFAYRLNKLLHRCGAVFGDRYHRRDLLTPREVRNALRYVLQNHKHHAHRACEAARKADEKPDAFSSAESFPGWALPPEHPCSTQEDPRVKAKTWLLAVGWRRHGLLHVSDAPR